MRTRSGLTLELAESREGLNMPEDTQSVDAQWGTPATTNRSTVESQPQSLSPLLGSPQLSSPPRSSTSVRHVGGHPYVPIAPRPRLLASSPCPTLTTQENEVQAPVLETFHSQIRVLSDEPFEHRTTRYGPTPSQSDALRRFSTGEHPWSPASPNTTPLKRTFSDLEEVPSGGKLGDELERLEKGEEIEEGVIEPRMGERAVTVEKRKKKRTRSGRGAGSRSDGKYGNGGRKDGDGRGNGGERSRVTI
ncbi:hypothetical protein BJ875DRAFT_256515 [Amylocarpus encephaloides]|uniref:Uncharacterized protein n=1 Tax=Amylocarpus encephaloides TaxID=45428 RepID=A0A9P8C6N6_9HELO|nr:hypothetical protein BJ875DRAFT_256515 [Amylocarpus encephaloides]